MLGVQRVGHLVKDCRDRSAKESWLSKREKMNYSEQDHDKSRDRKHERQRDNLAKEVSRQREAICAIFRAVEKITKRPNM